MPIPPVDPSFAVKGTEWGVGSVDPATQPAQAAGGGFGHMLTNAISSLGETQTKAAGAAQSLVDGSATDPSAVVMQVERAQLAMQLASQIRNKAVEAYQEVFHTQV
jgi:flagellar hook-basal body complex protein FliE